MCFTLVNCIFFIPLDKCTPRQKRGVAVRAETLSCLQPKYRLLKGFSV